MEILKTVDGYGNKVDVLVGDIKGKHEIINGKIVPKTAATLKAEALARCLQDRAEAYAQLNQDEMRFDDAINGTTTWTDAIKAIKAKYPKPL